MLDRKAQNRTKVLHLSHTVESGGAELALLRTLRVAKWDWLLQIPEDAAARPGVFTGLDTSSLDRVLGIGPRHGAGAASRRAGLLRFGSAVLTTAFKIRMHPRFRDVRVVFANGTRSATYGALIKLMSPGRTFVVHLRDTVSSESLGSVGALVMRKLVLPTTDGVVANSEHTLRSAEQYLRPAARRLTLPSPTGESVSFVTPALGSTDVLRIGLIARLTEWKGQRLLLDAFSRSFAPGTASLYFVGGASFAEDSYLRDLQGEISRLKLEASVHLVGHVEDVPSWIAAMDICVQASLKPEPLGQNVLQYLQAGATIIAADEGGPSEWIRDGHNGLLFAPRDAEALSAALKRLAGDHGLRHQLALGARATRIPSSDELTSELQQWLRRFDPAVGQVREDH